MALLKTTENIVLQEFYEQDNVMQKEKMKTYFVSMKTYFTFSFCYHCSLNITIKEKCQG